MASDDPRDAVIDWARFVDVIGRHQRFLLTTHIRPDCDAVGSTLAMAAILKQLGKQVRIVTAFDLPPHLRFLDALNEIEKLGRDTTADPLRDIDLLLILDTSAWAQLGEMADVVRTTKAAKAVLDHHVSSDDLGAESFKSTDAEATGRVVFEAAKQLGVALTPHIASCLFAALATDTGWFRFSSTTGQTYRLAGQLVDAGAVPHEMYRDLYENDSVARLKLMGRALARAETEFDGRLIYTTIHHQDFVECGALPSDSEDIVNMTLTVGGTEVAVIFVGQPDGGYKISFRSRSTIDCTRVAEQFGGGGHRNAAGAFVADAFPAGQAKVLDVVRAAMR
jgi:phosphoesterase RecJ-like protein